MVKNKQQPGFSNISFLTSFYFVFFKKIEKKLRQSPNTATGAATFTMRSPSQKKQAKKRTFRTQKASTQHKTKKGTANEREKKWSTTRNWRDISHMNGFMKS